MNMKITKGNLSVTQRIVIAFLYIAILFCLCRLFSADWLFLARATGHYQLLFISVALLLVLGVYIAEPFFTKPVNVLTNAVAALLVLLGIQDTSGFVGYQWLIIASILLILISALIIMASPG